MLIILRANKRTGNMRADVGQYDVFTKKMQLWINSSRLVNGETKIVIPSFDEPEDYKSVILIDEGTDQQMNVPVATFKESLQDDGTHVFEFADWFKKYRRLL